MYSTSCTLTKPAPQMIVINSQNLRPPSCNRFPGTLRRKFFLPSAIADGKKYFLRKVPGKRLQDGGLKFWLLITIICGAGFVSVQLVEYIKLVGEGFTPSGYREGSLLAEHALADPVKYGAGVAGMYGSTFFTMTGFHGFHVTCGVISMLYLYFTKVLPEKYSPQDYRGIEVIGLYWHFVDLVWIILFTIVYLI